MECAECEANIRAGHAPTCSRRCKATDAQDQCERTTDHAASMPSTTSGARTSNVAGPTVPETPMADPITVTVSDPATGNELESRTFTDDYTIIVAGDRYVSGIQTYNNGTHVITVKQRSPQEAGSHEA